MADLTTRVSDRLEPVFARLRRTASDPVKSTRTAVVIGRLLGAAFTICFLTGVFSHILQDYPYWITAPRPVSIYRITQGAHVISGIASIPLLLAKLWTVFPRLFEWPPFRSVAGILERLSIAVLITASLVEVAIGLLNIFQVYVFPFPFRQTHFALGWVVFGSLAIHIAVKLPLIARYWRSGPRDRPQAGTVISRRGFVGVVGVSVGAVTLTTAGQTIDALKPFDVLAPRKQNIGPQGLPVNKTAMQAGVIAQAKSPAWELEVVVDGVSHHLDLDALRALPQTTADLPIACVEGWSQSAQWRGVRMRDLLEAVGAPAASDLRVRSLQRSGVTSRMEMPAAYSADPLTLVALELNGDVLDIDHGYPARIIAPGRPGALQTKWLATIEVVR
ncbi:molybdopterin-dependent oxidoreductase [Schumannella sp. 10F1B-5-1]|uniref:molybdopterin-dependent oxidoreductase n=1 Tax=Schumannella sp. 10F1B-5-1 TaxID=2590780 RepID=UPI001131752F|nr:molybdopterin-dependent oxidoreductase [Schumannella sp. 10F1B-5-1]TPW72820.1 molybdopterin-dependent oxidoreductase [Schumannella sp. 10F1B-5-1]